MDKLDSVPLHFGSDTYTYGLESAAEVMPNGISALYYMSTQLEYFGYSTSMDLPAIIDSVQKHLSYILVTLCARRPEFEYLGC